MYRQSLEGNSVNRHLPGHRAAGVNERIFVSGSTEIPSSSVLGAFNVIQIELPHVSASAKEMSEAFA